MIWSFTGEQKIGQKKTDLRNRVFLSTRDTTASVVVFFCCFLIAKMERVSDLLDVDTIGGALEVIDLNRKKAVLTF